MAESSTAETSLRREGERGVTRREFLKMTGIFVVAVNLGGGVLGCVSAERVEPEIQPVEAAKVPIKPTATAEVPTGTPEALTSHNIEIIFERGESLAAGGPEFRLGTLTEWDIKTAVAAVVEGKGAPGTHQVENDSKVTVFSVSGETGEVVSSFLSQGGSDLRPRLAVFPKSVSPDGIKYDLIDARDGLYRDEDGIESRIDPIVEVPESWHVDKGCALLKIEKNGRTSWRVLLAEVREHGKPFLGTVEHGPIPEVSRSPKIEGYKLTSEGWYCEETGQLVNSWTEGLFLKLNDEKENFAGNALGAVYWGNPDEEGGKTGRQVFDNFILSFSKKRGIYHSIEFGDLGLMMHRGRADSPISETEKSSLEARGGRYFTETGHIIMRPFLEFFETNGGVDIFGMPITEMLEEDGDKVQWFTNCKMRINDSGEVEFVPLGKELMGTDYSFVEPEPPQRVRHDLAAFRQWAEAHPEEARRLKEETKKIVLKKEGRDPRKEFIVAVSINSGPLTYERALLTLFGYHKGIEENAEIVKLIEDTSPAIRRMQSIMDAKLTPNLFKGETVPSLPSEDLIDHYVFLSGELWQEGASWVDYIGIYGNWWEIDSPLSSEEHSRILYRVAYTVLHEDIHHFFQQNVKGYKQEIGDPNWEFSHELFDLPVHIGLSVLDFEYDYQPRGFPILLMKRLEEAGYDDPLGTILEAVVSPEKGEELLGVYGQIRHPDDPDSKSPDFFEQLKTVPLDIDYWKGFKREMKFS